MVLTQGVPSKGETVADARFFRNLHDSSASVGSFRRNTFREAGRYSFRRGGSERFVPRGVAAADFIGEGVEIEKHDGGAHWVAGFVSCRLGQSRRTSDRCTLDSAGMC